MVLIHIYGTRSISLLLYDNQDTGSESPDIENGVDGTIFTHKISKYLRDNNTHTLQDGSKICW